MKKLLISALAISAMSTSIYAAGCVATGCFDVKITKLYMTAGGTLYVGTSGNEASLNCTLDGDYMSLKEGDVGKNAMYSLLLTAKTTNKKVNIRIQEGTADCRVLYVTD